MVLRTEEYKKNCFQQDSALPRPAKEVQTWLKGQFGKKFTESRAYNPQPKTLDDLKANIERKTKKISNILKSNFLNFQKRCELIARVEDGHIKIKLNIFLCQKNYIQLLFKMSY